MEEDEDEYGEWEREWERGREREEEGQGSEEGSIPATLFNSSI